MQRRRFLALTALGLALAPAGLGRPRLAHAQAGPVSTFVGPVQNSNAFIGIVSNGSQVIAYVCDGTDQGATLWGWFDGPLTSPQTQLASSNGLGLLLDTSGTTPHGQVVTRTGDRLDFQTEVATGAAGVWEAQAIIDGAAVLAGWVLLNDGQQRGIAAAAGQAQPVGFIDPLVNLARQPVSAGPGGGPMLVQPVSFGSSTLSAQPVNGFIDPNINLNRPVP